MKGNVDETDWKVNKVGGNTWRKTLSRKRTIGGNSVQESKQDTLYFIPAATLADGHPK